MHAAEEEFRARLKQLPNKYIEQRTLDNLFGLLCRCSHAAGRAGEEWDETFKAIESTLEMGNKEHISDRLQEFMYGGWARGKAIRTGKSAEEHLAQRRALESYQGYLSSLKEGWHDNRERSKKVYKCAEYAGEANIPLNEIREEIIRIVEDREEIDCKTYKKFVENYRPKLHADGDSIKSQSYEL